MSNDVYKKITDKMIESLKNGTVPWHKPWKGYPANAITGRNYSGINLLLLADLTGKYGSPYFLTFNQAKNAGGHVLLNEKGHLIVYWQLIQKEVEDEDGNIKVKKFPYIKLHYVYNIKQCGKLDKLEQKLSLQKNDEIIEPECVVSEYLNGDGPSLEFTGLRACYSPNLDVVRMPKMDLFDSSKHYYSTLFHEVIHSTGHEKRLNRFVKKNANFGSFEYSLEELVAELGSSFLRHQTGIEDESIFNNSVAYVENWLQALQEDPKMIIVASSKAQKAVDLVLKRNSVVTEEV